jgi:hypothetical protein
LDERSRNVELQFRVSAPWVDFEGREMTDSEIYRKFAEECQRMAKTAREHDKKILLEHAAFWLKLAEEAEKDQTGKNKPNNS